jgi:hypothetical protein
MEVDLGVGEDIGMEEDPPAGPKYYSWRNLETNFSYPDTDLS